MMILQHSNDFSLPSNLTRTQNTELAQHDARKGSESVQVRDFQANREDVVFLENFQSTCPYHIF